MTVALLDSGVWLASIDERDALFGPARELLARDERSFAALELTLYEIANVVVRKWRSRSLALQLVDGVAAVCGERLIRLDDALLTAAIETAERGRLTVYGAAYVACAQLRGWTLYSTDRRDLVDPGHALMP